MAARRRHYGGRLAAADGSGTVVMARIETAAGRNRFDRPWTKAALAAVSLAGAFALAQRMIAPRPVVLPGALAGASGPATSPSGTVPLEYRWLCGGDEPDPIRLRRLHPYTWYQQRFANNMRDYFHAHDTTAARLLAHWHVMSSDARYVRLIEDEKSDSLTMQLETRATDQPRWPLLNLRQPIRVNPGQTLTVRLRMRARPPRRILAALKFDEPGGPRFVDVTARADEQWSDLSLASPTAEHGAEVWPTLVTDAGDGQLELASIVTDPARPESNGPATRYFVDFHINRHGFRDRDWAEAVSSDALRIACLGDSFTFGIGVHEQDAYPRVLEALCREGRSAQKTAVEVLNFGMPSYALDAELDVLLKDVFRFGPKIVVVQLCYNDAATMAQEAEFNNQPGPEGVSRYIQAMSEFIREHGYQQAIDYLLRIHEACRAHNARLVVGVFNALPGWEWEQMVREVLPAMQAAGIPAFDVARPISDAGLMGDAGIAHPADHHPNEKCHRIFAQELRRALDEQGWLP